MTELGIPLKCSSCRYFGNARLDNCPVCGKELIAFSNTTTKLLNRATRLDYIRSGTNSKFIISREKRLVLEASEQFLNLDSDIEIGRLDE